MRPAWLAPQALWWPTLLTAGILSLVAFLAGGGLSLSRMTTIELLLTIGSAVTVAGAVLIGPTSERTYGLWPVGLLIAFTALTALSVVWSVQPDDSFKDAGRMLAYSGVFGASVALAAYVPRIWPAVLGGVIAAAVAVCGYALLTKVFPNQLDAGDVYARLRAPYSYWNAIGLTAAMGAIGCMWLGARRSGHALLSALAYPAMGLMLLTLMLAYSRGALVALALGLALWFCVVPLRLRGAAVLLAGAVAAAGVVAWDFSTRALSTDSVALGARTTAGHQLGALLAAMLLALTLVGLAVGFLAARRAPTIRTRRRAGALLLCMLALAVLAFGGALAASHRGLAGSISHGLHSLTDPHAAIPPNTPGRLTAVGSVRARYWNEALKVFKAHPGLGAGAEGYATARLRYRTETLDVRHAHGYIVQTLADLGLVGLALTLMLLVAWMVAAGRSTHPFNRRWTIRRAPGARRMPPRARWRAVRTRRVDAPSSRRVLGGWRAGARGSWRAFRGWRPSARPSWRRWRIGDRSAPYSAERIGMLSMLCLVVVFGIHSLADWTWYVPGNACVALLCGGWLAGRGPIESARASALLEDRLMALPAGALEGDGVGARSAGPRLPVPARIRELDRARVGVACAVVIAALLAAWAQWQPQRSIDASQQALAQLASAPRRAEADARAAVARDPLSAQALFTLSTVQHATGQLALARSTLQRAVRLQPSNPQTWLTLGQYDLSVDPGSALKELGAAIYLNPESVAPEAIARLNPEAIAIHNDYVQALRASTTPR